jgi:arylsulfatase A-like enzyme
MTHRVSAFLCQFRTVLRPWLCFVVYVWALAFQAVYGSDYETFFDRFISAAPLLWTLIAWAGLFTGMVTLGALCWSASSVQRINEFLCRIACLVISGFFLKRWLDNWQLDVLSSKVFGWLLLLVIFPLYLAVRRRRKTSPRPVIDIVPSWQDIFSYAVLPVMVATVVTVCGRVVVTIAYKPLVAANSAATSAFRPSIVLIVADSLRAQSMSLYGYTEKTTPHIDRFAESSSVYLRMHANATGTIPSVLTLLTGRHPLSHGRLNRELPPRPEARNLLNLLSVHGYSIGAVTSNGEAFDALQSIRSELKFTEEMAFRFNLFPWLHPAGIYPTRFSGRLYDDLAGMLPFLAFPRRASMEGNISDTIAQVKNLMVRLNAPFFLFIHVQEPHGPYQLPDGFELISVSVDSSKLKTYAPYSPALQPVVDVYRGLYELTIKRMDSELGNFLEEMLREKDILVILTGDHGESFERGYFLHGKELYENSTKVPLLIHYPGQKKGERVEGLTQSTDIAPTILNLLGIPKPSWMEGQSLKPVALPPPAETIAINYDATEGVDHHLPTKIAIWWDKYKLIAPCQSPEALLYDLQRDPDELVDIAAGESGIVDDLKRRLKARLLRQSSEPRVSCPSL